ncbi:MAG: Uma2 family endonuclease [Desulfococcaceae bacterium]|nr:Uma2 family endonuclease [Desulfococcaceae bacterium]
MNWAAICENPLLKELPFKIQTDRWGNIIMSPATNEHGMYQAKIVAFLSRMAEKGTVISECSVQTKEGVKVADAAWASDEFISRNIGQTPFAEAPEICVEILSPSNSRAEMDEKKELYFARGAKEFWTCGRNGNLDFYKNTGWIPQSELIPGFPDKIIIHT